MESMIRDIKLAPSGHDKINWVKNFMPVMAAVDMLKEEVKKHLDAKGIEYVDFGCHNTESCDYPDMADAPCKAVTSGDCTYF